MALVDGWDQMNKGDWFFLNDDTYIAVQFGDDSFTESVVLPIAVTEYVKTPWNWNGNKEFPSLTPSILVWGKGRDNPATWHGYLTDGKLVTV